MEHAVLEEETDTNSVGSKNVGKITERLVQHNF